VKLKAQDLAANKNTTLDKSLADAQQNGTYDKTYIDTMQNLLKKYQTKLQQTFSAAQGNNEKQLLQKEFKNAALLYEQSSQQN
jgi:RNase P subunit RPR2